MALLKWNSRYSVNISEIDKQHEHLINTINEMHDSMKSGKSRDDLDKIFSSLITYTQKHFALEERFMTRADYRDFTAHKKEHEDFTAIVVDYKKQFDEGKSTVSIKTMNFLMTWVTKHIMSSDKKYTVPLNDAGIQ